MNKKKLVKYFTDMKRDGMSKMQLFGVTGGVDFIRMMNGQITVEYYVSSVYFNCK